MWHTWHRLIHCPAYEIQRSECWRVLTGHCSLAPPAIYHNTDIQVCLSGWFTSVPTVKRMSQIQPDQSSLLLVLKNLTERMTAFDWCFSEGWAGWVGVDSRKGNNKIEINTEGQHIEKVTIWTLQRQRIELPVLWNEKWKLNWDSKKVLV